MPTNWLGKSQTRAGIQTWGPNDPNNCDDFNFGVQPTPDATEISNYATEHILEFQLIKAFFDWANGQFDSTFRNPDPKANVILTDLCHYMKWWWYPPRTVFALDAANPGTNTPINWVTEQFPGRDNGHAAEFGLLYSDVNGAKEKVCSGPTGSPLKYSSYL